MFGEEKQEAAARAAMDKDPTERFLRSRWFMGILTALMLVAVIQFIRSTFILPFPQVDLTVPQEVKCVVKDNFKD